MSDEEKKLWEDNVEVELRVVLPPKLVGGKGYKIQSRQYVPLDFVRSNLDLGVALDLTIEEMAQQVVGAAQKEVGRGTER